MYVVHTVRGSGPSRNFDLSIPFPSFRLAFFLWSAPSRSRVCLPPDPNLLLRLYHQHKNERGKIKIGSAMQRRAIYIIYIRGFCDHTNVLHIFDQTDIVLKSGWSSTMGPPYRLSSSPVFVSPPDATAKPMASSRHLTRPCQV